MKKVVLLRSNPVDPDPRIEKMANTLMKKGDMVSIVAWDRDSNHRPIVDTINLDAGEVQITRAGFKGQFSGGFKKNLWPLVRFTLFLLSWLIKNKNRYDIIQSCDLDTGMIADVCAKMLKKAHVYDIADYYVASHNLEGTRIGCVVQSIENKVINNADAVIICTEQRKKQITGTHPHRLEVIHNTPDIQVSGLTAESPHNDRMKIVYVGILSSVRMIDQIADVVKKRNDCEFHIAGFGGGMEQYFKEESEACERIFFYGRLPYKKAIELEQACDIMTAIYDPSIPNHRNAAPNKFYEALMLGKPVIMAKNTGMDNIVSENDLGCVIEYNVNSLNKAIDELISKKSEWKEMGNRGRKLYDTSYSWSLMEKRLIALYQHIDDK